MSWNPFENVSWTNPLGGSVLGNLGGVIQNDLGLNKLQNWAGQVNLPNLSHGGGMSTDINVPAPSSSVPASPMAANPSPFANPTNDTTGADSFRNSYMSALKPNTAFTFNAQNPTTFGTPNQTK